MKQHTNFFNFFALPKINIVRMLTKLTILKRFSPFNTIDLVNIHTILIMVNI